jgi:hypothetical protein
MEGVDQGQVLPNSQTLTEMDFPLDLISAIVEG